MASVSSPLGTVDAGRGQHARARPRGRSRTGSAPAGFSLHAHRGQRAAAHDHLPAPRHLRRASAAGCSRPRRTSARGRACRGGEGQDEDRRVGRVDLAVRGVVRQRRRQVAARGVDGRLHVAGGAVDVAVQVELQDDRRRAQRCWSTSSRSRPAMWPNCRSSGAATEVAIVSGLAPGRRGRDRDGREVDLRQRRHREQIEGQRPAQRQRQGEQRRRDRSPDERLSDAHRDPAARAAPGGRTPDR